MSTNWKQYINEPRFLIALLPGLETVRDNINSELENLKAAISMTGSRWGRNDPKYLLALAPGYEIARDNINEEIESIRQAIEGRAAVVDRRPAPGESMVPQIEGETEKRVYTKGSKFHARYKRGRAKVAAAAAAETDTAKWNPFNPKRNRNSKYGEGYITQPEFIFNIARKTPDGFVTNEQIKAEARRQKEPHLKSLSDRGRLSVAISVLKNSGAITREGCVKGQIRINEKAK